MGVDVDAVLDQIDQAGLSATAYRSAVRLMRLASANGGQARMSRRQAVELCGSTSDATMRTHLYQIAKAGLIDYHAGDDVFVRFLWWPLSPTIPAIAAETAGEQMRAERANEAEIELDNDNLRAERASEMDEMRAERANEDLTALGLRAQRVNLRAERANEDCSVTRARSGWVGGLFINSQSRNDQKPTHPPLPSPTQLPEAQQLALGLLIDPEIGISYQVAQILAASKPPADIYRLVDEWLPERRQGKVQAGALVSRLRGLKAAVESADIITANLSRSFLESDLFQRHRLPDELLAGEPRRKYSDVTFADDSARRRQYLT